MGIPCRPPQEDPAKVLEQMERERVAKLVPIQDLIWRRFVVPSVAAGYVGSCREFWRAKAKELEAC